MLNALRAFQEVVLFLVQLGLFLYQLPYWTLNAAERLKSRGLTVLAYPCYAVGWTLYVLVRLLWYGLFIAMAGGLLWFLYGLVKTMVQSF